MTLAAEHRDEHFSDVVMDCPLCVAEMASLTGDIMYTARLGDLPATARIEEGDDT